MRQLPNDKLTTLHFVISVMRSTEKINITVDLREYNIYDLTDMREKV